MPTDSSFSGISTYESDVTTRRIFTESRADKHGTASPKGPDTTLHEHVSSVVCHRIVAASTSAIELDCTAVSPIPRICTTAVTRTQKDRAARVRRCSGFPCCDNYVTAFSRLACTNCLPDVSTSAQRKCITGVKLYLSRVSKGRRPRREGNGSANAGCARI